jgi:DNA-binding response OmpR family regulator
MTKKRILLVDDEEELLKAMRIRLSSWGYDVITATCGEEAIRIAKDSRRFLDAIILDIMMPGIDGIETLRRIRRFNKKVPILMLTAYTSKERMKNAEAFGISGFIPKGAEVGEPSNIIRIVLKGAKKTSK